MNQKRYYEWFKKCLCRASKYDELKQFKEECPALYERHMKQYQKEQEPQSEINALLGRM